jgi:hypothetical protein
MAFDVDGSAVLRVIAENPHAFPDVMAELNKVARTLVVKQLKAKSTNLKLVREIHCAIGGEAFVLILDDLIDASGATLLKKLDKDNSELLSASLEWCRKRIADLASGAAEPAKKVAQPPRTTRSNRRPTLAPEQADAARELKATSIKLEGARLLWRDLGDASFRAVLVSLTDLQRQKLAKKLDKDNPKLGEFLAETLQDRIVELASGRAEPVFKNIMDSDFLSAVGRRRTKPA